MSAGEGQFPSGGRFALFAAASPIHDPEELDRQLEPFLTALHGLGGVSWRPEEGPPSLPLVVFVATGGTERMVLEALQADPAQPVHLITHPGHNSLPAALEVLGRLQQLSRRGRIHYLSHPQEQAGLTGIAEAVHGLAVRRELMSSRLGLLGGPSDWLVASSPPPEVVRATWGPTVVALPFEPLLPGPGTEAVPGEGWTGDRLRERSDGLLQGATASLEPSPADLLAAEGIVDRLRSMVRAERLNAVAVRCFDLVVQSRTSGCLALSRLNDEGTIAGCEGDLPATLAMLWVRLLLRAPSWMANPSRVDPARGVLSLAHCTVPLTLSPSYRLRSHFESGLGVALQGELPLGPVTLIRLGGPDLQQLWVQEGELLRNTDHPDLCRTQVEVEIGPGALQELLSSPFGNHLVVVWGHHSGVLRRWHGSTIPVGVPSSE
jgi:L-fucose isomerase-like protein